MEVQFFDTFKFLLVQEFPIQKFVVQYFRQEWKCRVAQRQVAWDQGIVIRQFFQAVEFLQLESWLPKPEKFYLTCCMLSILLGLGCPRFHQKMLGFGC